MATVLASRPVDLRKLDRAFYLSMSLAIAALVFTGFARSFYLSHWFAPPPGTPKIGPLLFTHGIVFTSWMFLSVLQPSLIAAGNVRLHRRIGIAGAGLAALMVVLGNLAAIAAIHVGFIGLGDPYAFYADPFVDIQTFGLFVALAVLKRGDPDSHKRLILLALTQVLEPGLARMPLSLAEDYFPYFSLIGMNFVIVAGILFDLATRRRIHPVWIWGGAINVVSEAGRLLIMRTAPWLAFAHFMARLYVP